MRLALRPGSNFELFVFIELAGIFECFFPPIGIRKKLAHLQLSCLLTETNSSSSTTLGWDLRVAEAAQQVPGQSELQCEAPSQSNPGQSYSSTAMPV